MISSVISKTHSKPIGTIKKLTAQYSGLSRALSLATGYAIWISLFKLLCMTVVTYLVVSSSTGHGARFEEINDAYSSVELMVLGAGSLLFTLGINAIYPRPSRPRDQLFKRSLPGLLHGSAIALGLAALFLVSGGYRYLGSLVLYEERPLLALFGLLLKAFSILSLVLCEELLFRRRILDLLLRPEADDAGARELPGGGPRIMPVPESPLPRLSSSTGLRTGGAILLSAAMYAGVKFLQFDLSWMQGITILLVSILLGLKSEAEGDLASGTAFWAATLIITHVCLGLPIFGNDSSSGLILLKYHAGGGGRLSEAMRYLTGGTGGLIGSLSLQFLVLFEILRDIFRDSDFKLYIFKRTKRGS